MKKSFPIIDYSNLRESPLLMIFMKETISDFCNVNN